MYRHKNDVKTQMVRITNVRMMYSKEDGLKRVDLAVHNGEFVFLVGPSGAGKSTVLKLIYMDVMPTDGLVVVNGYNSVNIKKREIPYLRRKIGIIFQDFKLLNDRSVFENVAFTLRVTGTKRNEMKKKVLRRDGRKLPLISMIFQEKYYGKDLNSRGSMGQSSLCMEGGELILTSLPISGLESQW